MSNWHNRPLIYGHVMARTQVKPRIRKRPNGLWVCGIQGEYRQFTGNTPGAAYRYWLAERL